MNTRELAQRFNLHRAGRDWRGDCPVCGYAAAFCLTDRNGRPLGWCASCQDGAGIGTLLRGMSDDGTPPPNPKPLATATEGRDRALRLWAQGGPLAGTVAETYLAARRIPHVAESASLRFLAACPHPNAGKLPAMLALVVNAAGASVAVHRTFLRADGQGKAQAEPSKATLGPMLGGAIRLHPVAPEIIVAEGIETAAAAARHIGIPAAWAAMSCGNLARLALPNMVQSIVVAADNDPPDKFGRRPGPDAAWAAAERWRAEGRAVRVAMPKHLVECPIQRIP